MEGLSSVCTGPVVMTAGEKNYKLQTKKRPRHIAWALTLSDRPNPCRKYFLCASLFPARYLRGFRKGNVIFVWFGLAPQNAVVYLELKALRGQSGSFEPQVLRDQKVFDFAGLTGPVFVLLI